MKTPVIRPILMVGEHDVGKTHYGGQLLKRLMNSDGYLRMDGAADNLEPFELVMDSLNEGRLADRTPTTTYNESVWPIIDSEGRKAHLVWPDYGGEQIREIIEKRRVPNAWRSRITQSRAWILLIRLQKIRTDNDIFSRPLASLKGNTTEHQETNRKQETPGTGEIRLSDQARLIELLQILVQTRLTGDGGLEESPRLLILLTCWDEVEGDKTEKGTRPVEILRQRLPMFLDFVLSNWENPLIFGLSALGRRLDKNEPDRDYVSRGSEHFGYVVLKNGTHCKDLTLPIRKLLSDFHDDMRHMDNAD